MTIFENPKSNNMAGNKNLAAAKANKKDEFYTQRVDIENELKHYKPHFSGKVVSIAIVTILMSLGSSSTLR